MLVLSTRTLRGTLCVAGSVVVLGVLAATVANRPADTDDAAASPASSRPNPTGEAMPVGDLDGWRQVFTDDFTTDVALGDFPAAVAAKWSVYASPAKDSFGHGSYSPERVVSVDNGVLNKHIRAEDGEFLVAALLPKVPGTTRNGQLYGRYAVRFKTDRIEGYKIAWLLWPDSRVWPRDGEIDFPERDLASDAVTGFVHHQGARRGSDQESASAPFDSAKWHTAVIEWSPDLVVFILDGDVIERVTQRVPNTPMHWVLQTETTLTSTMPPVTAAGNVQIDWVAAWQYDPTLVATPPTSAAPSTTAKSAVPDVRRNGAAVGPRYRVFRS
jgi:beta-glucanase (GH16 family)